MKKNKFVFVIIALFFSLSSLANSGSLTALSKKAANLKRGMSWAAVINLLGRPTWATIPGDTGDWSPSPGISFVLYWKNQGCGPVVVEFNNNYQATGWDEGRSYCAKDAYLFEPTEEYSCTKSDRKKYCK